MKMKKKEEIANIDHFKNFKFVYDKDYFILLLRILI